MDDVEIEGLSAEEAFALLGNETRMGILRALWEADEPCTFADLRKRVAPDDKGNFNYHIGRLTDHFVRKTDEGYDLRFGGEQVVRAVLTGTITSAPSIQPRETDERCVYCGAPVEMAYEEDVISVRCTDCGGVVGGEYPDGSYMHYEFPPAGLIDRTREAAIDAAHVLYDSKIAPMMKGVCPQCAGQIDVTFERCPDHEEDESGLCPNCDSRFEAWTQYECEYCLYTRRTVTWFAALNHPAVIAFLHDHGLTEMIPVRKLTWDNARFVRDVTVTVVETDPNRFRVAIPVDDETLTVVMDDTLDVVSVSRSARDGRGRSGDRK